MNKLIYVIWNMNGNYYDHLMGSCPAYLWTDEELLDYFSMMTGN